MIKQWTALICLALTLLSACTPTAGNPAVAPAATQPPVLEQSPMNAAPPPGFENGKWADIVSSGRGQTVNFYMWGGSDTINTWVTGYAATRLKQRYDITLNMVPVTDIVDTVNKVLGEKQAGKTSDGSVDLIWINGENFRSMHQAELLYGPWAQFLPNSVYVNQEDPSVAYDFGTAVEGYESPYGKAQFVMVYDSARVADPPKTVPELLAWAKSHPGKFTYAAPPDFTGSAFVRHVCYSATGGYEQFLGAFNAELFGDKFTACWKALQEIAPSLWRAGQTYPENRTRMQDLFANGEIDFDMTYNPAEASSLIAQGKYPATARTFIFETGTIANTHYLAIPFDAAHQAGAMLAANFLLSPEAQLDKARPENWGDLTALDPARLPVEWQQQFAALDLGPATLPDAALAAHRLPELQADWLVAIEQAWEENVLHGP